MAVTDGARAAPCCSTRTARCSKTCRTTSIPRGCGSRAARRALATFGELGMPIAVVSNQPGVALGRFPETALGAARHRLAELFAQQGAMLAGFF